MITKFDSFSRFETPQIFVCSPGCTYNNGVLSNVSGVLFGESDMELIGNWNALSEINFRVHKLKLEDPIANEEASRIYRSLKNRRVLYLDGIGFFIVRKVEEGYSGGLFYKDIMAESCETEISDKNVPFIDDGTYQLYTGHVEYNDDGTVKMNSESGQALTGLIDYLMLSIPLWSLGDIDTVAATRYRTFEDVSTDQNIHSFMMEDMQNAYEIIFDFDITNRTINIYDQSSYLGGDHDTDIHITKDDFINSIDVTESSDDLYTAISVFGADDLSINAVNPLGTNVIYDFSYYTDWMSSGLGEKVSTWQNAVKAIQETYYNKNVLYYAGLTTASNINLEIDRLNIAITMYERCRANVVAEADDIDVEKYNEVLTQAGIDPSGLIPENSGYTWIKFASNSLGTDITSDPYGMQYVGFAYSKPGKAESIDPSDYSWHKFRNGESIPDGRGTYTWIKFADTSYSGMSDNPDVQDEEGNGRAKNCIGISLGNASPTRSTEYDDYTWVYTNRNNIGVPQVLARIVTLYQSANQELTIQQEALAELNEELFEMYQEIAEIHDTYSIEGYFTPAEQAELNNYIYEGTYADEYISVTDSMSQSARLAQMKTLYDRAVQQLEKISTPSQEFVIDSQNFIFVKEFQRWSDQLEAGCAINVEINDNDVAPLFLTAMTVNYDDKSLQLTFGNRLDRMDAKSVFEDVLGDVKRSANTLSFVKDSVSVIKSGKINKMQEALDRSRTLTKGQALSSTNETVVIDDTGYTGAKQNTDGSLDRHQIKINGRNIVFSDDAWETCKTAIGEILIVGSDGSVTSKYGINAEVILGELIMGNQLKIVNSSGEDMFVVTEDKITAKFENILDDYALAEDTISGVDVLYCRATSTTVLDDDTITVPWSTVAPQWVEGEYIWQKTVTTFDDGSTNESDPTCLSGAQGKDGKGIVSVVVKYAVSSSSTVIPSPETEWGDSIPTIPDGYYLWVRTRTTYSGDEEEEEEVTDAYTISRNGEKGDDGRGIIASRIEYVVGDSGTEAPTTGWSTTFPTEIGTGKFLWTRTVDTYSDRTEAVTSMTVSASSVGLNSVIEEYYLSTSSESPQDGTWSTLMPVWTPGTYIWTRSHLYWTDNTETTTDPVLSSTLNKMNETLNQCVTDIEINSRGIQQNTEYSQQLYNQIAKINAYIQTGVLSVDEDGKTSYGVKIGETLVSTDVYVRQTGTPFSSNWMPRRRRPPSGRLRSQWATSGWSAKSCWCRGRWSSPGARRAGSASGRRMSRTGWR